VDCDELEDRFFRDRTLAALRDSWDLWRFLAENKRLREVYYDFIAAQIQSFTQATRLPDDKCLRDVVMLMLEWDRSYGAFLYKIGVRTPLEKRDERDVFLIAGASTILFQYAKDRGL